MKSISKKKKHRGWQPKAIMTDFEIATHSGKVAINSVQINTSW